MSLENIEFCPFCKNTGLDEGNIMDEQRGTGDGHIHLWSVYCDNCEAEGPKSDTREGSVKLWNTRSKWENSNIPNWIDIPNCGCS